jgi:hypothetical protein
VHSQSEWRGEGICIITKSHYIYPNYIYNWRNSPSPPRRSPKSRMSLKGTYSKGNSPNVSDDDGTIIDAEGTDTSLSRFAARNASTIVDSSDNASPSEDCRDTVGDSPEVGQRDSYVSEADAEVFQCLAEGEPEPVVVEVTEPAHTVEEVSEKPEVVSDAVVIVESVEETLVLVTETGLRDNSPIDTVHDEELHTELELADSSPELSFTESDDGDSTEPLLPTASNETIPVLQYESELSETLAAEPNHPSDELDPLLVAEQVTPDAESPVSPVSETQTSATSTSSKIDYKEIALKRAYRERNVELLRDTDGVITLLESKHAALIALHASRDESTQSLYIVTARDIEDLSAQIVSAWVNSHNTDPNQPEMQRRDVGRGTDTESAQSTGFAVPAATCYNSAREGQTTG